MTVIPVSEEKMSKISQDIIKRIEKEQLKSDVPEFGPGDTVVVQVRVKEGDKEAEKKAEKADFYY